MVLHKYLLLVFVLFLQGCFSTNNIDIDITKENMFIKTKNYPALIDLYKGKLKVQESEHVRELLAQTYLDFGDSDSALFTISPLTKRVTYDSSLKKKENDNVSFWGDIFSNEKKSSLNWLLIQANAELALGMNDAALSSSLQALQFDKKNAEVSNLIGVIYAGEGNIYEARHYFYLARENLYDDVKVKNNLALLFMMEGKFDSAVKMLLPLYVNGQADKQIESNLTIALVKTNDFDLMRKVLKPKYSDREIAEKYKALKNVKPTEWVQAFNGYEE